MFCALYNAGQCRSCQWLDKPYPEQLSEKQATLQQLLADHAVEQWLPPVASAEKQFRNKAKMVVTGSVEAPVFGIADKQGEGVDLTACPLYPDSFAAVFTALKPFIARAGLTPYNIARRRGELKYLLLTESSQGGMMLRFVLRSTKKLAQLEKALPELLQQLPQLVVVSANIQPVHMAILEGEQEIILSAQHALAERLNNVPLWIRPQSFFQTNAQQAAKLYQTAADWCGELPIHQMWDLFCGVGGFGLHCATPEMSLTGIEISAEAIACAKDSAQQLGLNKTTFMALDSTRYALSDHQIPDLVLVNPPRRGIGAELCNYLRQVAPKYIMYSSCNPVTMASDIQRLDNYQIKRVQLFDLFPHTAHCEVLCLLQRSN